MHMYTTHTGRAYLPSVALTARLLCSGPHFSFEGPFVVDALVLRVLKVLLRSRHLLLRHVHTVRFAAHQIAGHLQLLIRILHCELLLHENVFGVSDLLEELTNHSGFVFVFFPFELFQRGLKVGID